MSVGEFVLVETTYPARPRAVAQMFARRAIDEGLAACANVSAPQSSVYRWKGSLESGNEVLISFKTLREKSGALADWISKVHPYDVPYVGVLELDLPTGAYAAWVRESTGVTAASPARPKRRPHR